MWYLILALAAFMMVFLFSPVNVEVKYTLREKDDPEPNASLNLLTPGSGVRLSFFWGLLNLRLKLSSARLAYHKLSPVLKMRGRMAGGSGDTLAREETRITPEKAWYFYRLVMRIYQATAPAYRYLISGIKLHRFSWRTGLGLYEADQTGLAVGVLWAVKSNLIACLYRMLKKPAPCPVLEIIPVFNVRILNTQMNCIFSMSVHRILVSGLLALWFYLIRAVKT